MIFIVTALFCEAEPIITHFGLKKISSTDRMTSYGNDRMCMVISGTGMIKSSYATSYLLTKFSYSKNDILINIGICGAANVSYEKGTLTISNKVINHNSKRVFYPEMLVKHDLVEGSLESFSRPVKCAEETEADLVDMEAAGFMECAVNFLPLQNIHCLKVISDFLEGEKLEKEYVSSIMRINLKKISDYMDRAAKIVRSNNDVLTKAEHDLIKEISMKNNFTESMYFKLLSFARYYKIKYKNIDILKPYCNRVIRNKLESKQLLENILKGVH